MCSCIHAFESELRCREPVLVTLTESPVEMYRDVLIRPVVNQS